MTQRTVRPGEIAPSAELSNPRQRRLPVFGKGRAGKVAQSIVRSLTDAGRLGKPAKLIAREVRYPLRTVYRSLGRLTENGVVRCVPGGFALAAVLGDVTTDPAAILGFQNLRFTVSNWQTTPPPPCRAAKPWRVEEGGSAGPHERAELSWEGRRVTLYYHASTGNLDVIVAAKTPIPLLGMPELVGWLKAMLGLDRGESTRVTQIEVNADHLGFRLAPNYLELRDAGKWAQVLYQKGAVLRQELRLFEVAEKGGSSVSLERAAEILVEGSPLVQLRRIVERELELEMRRSGREGLTPGRVGGRDPSKVVPSEAIIEGYA
jgi:hypothetical protein